MRFDTLPLGDLCSSIEDGDWIESKDQGGEDFRLLQVGNVGVGVFRETGNYRFVSAETFGRLRCRELRVGDVLVSRMPDPVGRAWHIRRALPWKSITAVDVAIVSPNPAKLDPAYCAYFLNSPQNLDHARARAGGTTRLRITRRDLATFPIPIQSDYQDTIVLPFSVLALFHGGRWRTFRLPHTGIAGSQRGCCCAYKYRRI